MEDKNQPGGSWSFKPEDVGAVSIESAIASDQLKPIKWSASEFIEREKSSGWYVWLALATAAVSVATYFLFHDMITSIVIALAAILFGFAAARKPRQIEYTIDVRGITIAGKLMPYSMFKSFSLDKEGAITSILLMPSKRFAPMTVVYIDPENEDTVINHVAAKLPFDDSVVDTVDRLMRRIRF